MTQNNVIPLFQAATAADTDGSSEKKSTSKSNLLQRVANLDLDSQHPVTGLKYGGYLPLNYSIFAPEFFLLLNPGELKVYLYLSALRWRYPHKPEHVRAALPYLANGCGISRASISRHLCHLEELRLIKTVEINHKEGNIYQISGLAVWSSENHDQKQENESSKNETTQNCTTSQNLDGSSLKNGPHPSQNWTKDLSSSSSLNSLSQHEGFNSRWNQMSKKRVKREREVILSIFNASPEDLNEVYEVLIELETTGIAYDGSPCRSPIGLISSSWAAIKNIRKARRSVREQTPVVTQNTHKNEAQIQFEQSINQYLSTLDSQTRRELETEVEAAIRKQRPQIETICMDTYLYQSFLKEVVASRLGIENPEN